MVLTALSDALDFESSNVVSAISSKLKIEQERANLLFTHLKIWLWVCSTASKEREAGVLNVPKAIVIDNRLKLLDDAWHIFILHTKEYQNFCNNYLDYFVHHYPYPSTSNKKISLDVKKEQLSYLYDKIGKDTLLFWYKNLNDHFSPPNAKKP